MRPVVFLEAAKNTERAMPRVHCPAWNQPARG